MLAAQAAAAPGWWPAGARVGAAAQQRVGEARRPLRAGARSCRAPAAALARAARAPRRRRARCPAASTAPSARATVPAHRRGVDQRRQLDQPHAVGEARAQLAAPRPARARVLPMPPAPTMRDQPVLLQQRGTARRCRRRGRTARAASAGRLIAPRAAPARRGRPARGARSRVVVERAARSGSRAREWSRSPAGPSSLRSASTCTCRLCSSTTRPGQTQLEQLLARDGAPARARRAPAAGRRRARRCAPARRRRAGCRSAGSSRKRPNRYASASMDNPALQVLTRI